MNFSYQAFLDEHFPGMAAVALPRQYGLRAPTESNVKVWRSRGSIPGKWFVVLLVVAEIESGAPVSIARYMQGRA